MTSWDYNSGRGAESNFRTRSRRAEGDNLRQQFRTRNRRQQVETKDVKPKTTSWGNNTVRGAECNKLRQQFRTRSRRQQVEKTIQDEKPKATSWDNNSVRGAEGEKLRQQYRTRSKATSWYNNFVLGAEGVKLRQQFWTKSRRRQVETTILDEKPKAISSDKYNSTNLLLIIYKISFKWLKMENCSNLKFYKFYLKLTTFYDYLISVLTPISKIFYYLAPKSTGVNTIADS